MYQIEVFIKISSFQTSGNCDTRQKICFLEIVNENDISDRNDFSVSTWFSVYSDYLIMTSKLWLQKRNSNITKTVRVPDSIGLRRVTQYGKMLR